MARIVRSCMQSILKLVNSLIGMVGMAMILYAVWMITVWQRHMGELPFDGSDHPAPCFWNKLWGLQVSQATKSFLWRAVKESLATNLNLHKRKMREKPLCPICTLEPESVTHTLWSCRAAQDVWSTSSRKLQKLCIIEGPFKDIMIAMLSRLSPHELTEFAVTAKAIWHRRNTWVFEQKFLSPSQVSNRIHSELVDYLLRSEISLELAKPRLPPNASWTPPPPNVFKANWDAAVDSGNSKLGIGVIVRNSEGKVMASLCSPMALKPDPQLGEAVAARRASFFGAELGVQCLILEGDALSVVKAVQRKEECWSSFGLVIEDIKFILSKNPSWSITHVNRDSNVTAHQLAKFALSCKEECIYMEDVPPCIQLPF